MSSPSSSPGRERRGARRSSGGGGDSSDEGGGSPNRRRQHCGRWVVGASEDILQSMLDQQEDRIVKAINTKLDRISKVLKNTHSEKGSNPNSAAPSSTPSPIPQSSPLLQLISDWVQSPSMLQPSAVPAPTDEPPLLTNMSNAASPVSRPSAGLSTPSLGPGLFLELAPPLPTSTAAAAAAAAATTTSPQPPQQERSLLDHSDTLKTIKCAPDAAAPAASAAVASPTSAAAQGPLLEAAALFNGNGNRGGGHGGDGGGRLDAKAEARAPRGASPSMATRTEGNAWGNTALFRLDVAEPWALQKAAEKEVDSCFPPHIKQFARTLVSFQVFEIAAVILLASSVVLWLIEANWRASHGSAAGSSDGLEFLIWTTFALEVTLRLLACGGIKGFFALDDARHWNILDALLLFVGFWELVPLIFIGRAAPVLYPVRGLRLARLPRFNESCRLVLSALVDSWQPLAGSILVFVTWTVALSLAATEVAAAQLADLEGSTSAEDAALASMLEYRWGSIVEATCTVVLSTMGAVDWHETVLPMLREAPILGVAFVIYLLLSAWLLLLSTGMCVELSTPMLATGEYVRWRNDVFRKRQRWLNDAWSLWKQLLPIGSCDETALVTMDTFLDALQDPSVKALLLRLGLPLQGLTSLSLWNALDKNQSGRLNFQSFAEHLLLLSQQQRSDGTDLGPLRESVAIMRQEMSKVEAMCQLELQLLRQQAMFMTSTFSAAPGAAGHPLPGAAASSASVAAAAAAAADAESGANSKVEAEARLALQDETKHLQTLLKELQEVSKELALRASSAAAAAVKGSQDVDQSSFFVRGASQALPSRCQSAPSRKPPSSSIGRPLTFADGGGVGVGITGQKFGREDVDILVQKGCRVFPPAPQPPRTIPPELLKGRSSSKKAAAPRLPAAPLRPHSAPAQGSQGTPAQHRSIPLRPTSSLSSLQEDESVSNT